ncbi:MAG: hypothetical protein HY046_09145 [Acidobacteria bacterium]|nr:hypothetical protein [Acidobacteriota bacterium]
MGLDIRIPIGLMFTIFGVLLVIFGVSSDPTLYVRSLGVNLNVWWGITLAAFGAAMYLFGRRARS